MCAHICRVGLQYVYHVAVCEIVSMYAVCRLCAVCICSVYEVYMCNMCVYSISVVRNVCLCSIYTAYLCMLFICLKNYDLIVASFLLLISGKWRDPYP